uniref:Uncharacterized protein n=1 Tax=Candidatus Kentrum sp. SD TaxID=2126332 RepID=A0A450YGB3_9GAMM|nr:MAG: hypothetical protein BECKSD772F_GA0070984_100744 [Candidatus Kentron sp. SD]VFK40577.1 MAG: hypothetical protein BECKSD772E_GA0070983_100743 [Candidatus Kentron sp. SD]VFK80220.1 MAG: hypothetical protein BECKSD772D_GA0070982_10944 [Candidatus Kentron sp. SD]
MQDATSFQSLAPIAGGKQSLGHPKIINRFRALTKKHVAIPTGYRSGRRRAGRYLTCRKKHLPFPQMIPLPTPG